MIGSYTKAQLLQIGAVIEEFTDEKELVVVRKAMNAVNYLRKCGKQALGRFTFVLTKEGV